MIPTDLSNCVSWYNAMDNSSLTLNGSNGVTVWKDRGSGGVNTTPAVTAPTYVQSSPINNKPAIDFTAGNLQASALPANPIGDLTFFCVCRRSADNIDWNTMLGLGTSGDELGWYIDNGSGLNQYSGTPHGTQTTLPIDTNHILSIRRTAPPDSKIRFRINGVENTFTYNSTGSITMLTSSTGIGGGGGGATELWKGYIGEIILYTRELDIGEIRSVEEYLQDKWFGPTRLVSTTWCS